MAPSPTFVIGLSASAADLLLPWRHQRCFLWSQWRRLRSSAHFCGRVQLRLHHARLAARHLAQRQHGMRCSWRSRQCGSCRCMDFKPIELLIAAWLLKLGPRLTKSNIEYVILQGSQVHRTKWQRVLQCCSRWLDLVPRWAGQRLLFASDDVSL